MWWLKKMYDFLINGSGFKAFYLALKLREKYSSKSIVIKSQSNIGGIYNSPKYNNYNLDLGCHLYDYTDQKFIDTFKINLKKVIPIKLKYASINDKKISNNYSVYDFRNTNKYNCTLKSELLNKKISNNKSQNLFDFYHSKFGSLPLNAINNFCFKLTGKNLREIDARSNEIFFFERLLIDNNKNSIKYKKEGFDDLIAANTSSIHDYKNKFIIFSFNKGNYGFLKHVLNLLKNNKIDISTKKVIKSKKIYNTSPSKLYSKSYAVNVPLHLLYFETNFFFFSYLHDFSNNPIFRISSPGFYTNQIFNKKSYICIEIPDPNLIYKKDMLIKLSSEYLKDICKISFLRYYFVKNSYPSIYKVNNNYKDSNYLNPFLYSKKKIMNSIDTLLSL